MEQDGRTPLPQVEAKREHLFSLIRCSKFAVSCLYEDERSLCLFHPSTLLVFGHFFAVCCVCRSVLLFFLIKDGLRQQGEGYDGWTCAGIASDTKEAGTRLSISWGFPAVRVFLERRRLFSADICAADVAPRRQTF